jgi:hypothetical protein
MGPHDSDNAGRDGEKKKEIKPLEVARSLSVVVEISVSNIPGRRSTSENRDVATVSLLRPLEKTGKTSTLTRPAVPRSQVFLYLWFLLFAFKQDFPQKADFA